LKHKIYIVIGLALILSACGSQAAPTIDPVQIQATAAVMASTMSAQTQAAIPTLTQTPLPSPTMLPTSTETPVPTVVVVELTATSSSTDPCNTPLFANPASSDGGKNDKKANIQIRNSTKAPITVSLYLSKNAFGQCGFVSYVLSPSQSVTISGQLPLGCYYASAYVNDPKKPSRPNGASACITGDDRTTITVSADQIKITGP
jgi:hypothetical protein